jgi:ferredoxin--NADP+ reductase
MNIELTDQDTLIDSEVIETYRITPPDTDEIRRLVLQVDDPAFRARPGQNIGVVVEGDSAFGRKQHVRRYAITEVAPVDDEDGVAMAILVKRCFYIDEVSGEKYPGVASNFLCDIRAGQKVSLVGPYKNPFKIPSDPNANLLLIGTGTGIAPFRTMIKEVYREGIEWKGDVRLFFGARSGMESLYTNEKGSDMVHYYDKDTFEAFNALALRPLSDERDALKESLSTHIDEAWELLNKPNTHVYLAGLRKTADITDKVFSERASSDGKDWESIKQGLIDEERWQEVLYA